jgi:hypothetical protein
LEELMELWIREGAEKIIVYKHRKGAGGSPEAIRKFLIRLNNTYKVEGVFLIGELPVVFFEELSSSRNIVYTSDYFFMELQGTWSLGDGNKASVPSKPPPVICAGRVFIGSDTGISSTRPPVTEYYKTYLKKAIDFRKKGEAYRQGRKAVVVSNLGGVAVYENHLANLYSSIDTFDGATNAQYENTIESNYDWILYYGHSDPGQHQMAGGDVWTPFHYHEAETKINVFQFESCGVGAIAWLSPSDPSNLSSPSVAVGMTDCFVANILGNNSRGVMVLGPSIPGFFSNMDRFYGYLRNGATFGEAFRLWMAGEIEGGGPHYMSLYGDPFLYFRPVNPSIYRRRTWLEKLFDSLFGKGIEYM